VQGLRNSSGVAAEILKQKPDLLLLQEAGSLNGLTKSALSDWHIAGPFGDVVIASKYPFDRISGLTLPPMNNKPCYIRCELTVSGHRLVVYSVHLPTPRHGLTALMERGEEGSDDWRHNINTRMSYSALVSARVRNEIGPRLIGGDLNAPSSSLVVRMLEGNTLTDAFERAGKGYGYTYGHALKFRHSYVRIDHLLASSEWHPVACWAGDADGSDHRPVIADYVIE